METTVYYYIAGGAVLFVIIIFVLRNYMLKSKLPPATSVQVRTAASEEDDGDTNQEHDEDETLNSGLSAQYIEEENEIQDTDKSETLFEHEIRHKLRNILESDRYKTKSGLESDLWNLTHQSTGTRRDAHQSNRVQSDELTEITLESLVWDDSLNKVVE